MEGGLGRLTWRNLAHAYAECEDWRRREWHAHGPTMTRKWNTRRIRADPTELKRDARHDSGSSQGVRRTYDHPDRSDSMLDRANKLRGYALHATDGDIGTVKEFLFDDKFWTIRYLTAETGRWLPDRQVLISPYSLGVVHTEARTISVNLSKQRVLDSPPLTSDEPVSRQYEESYYSYFQYPLYFGGGNMWGTYPYIARNRETSRNAEPGTKHWDAHLRSTAAVTGYHMQAVDGEIGHVQDFIIDDETWAIRYLVVDTRNWWPGKMVLVAPHWTDKVSWTESKVFTSFTRDQLRSAPEYSDATAITRDYESRLYEHYKQSGYWITEGEAATHAR